LSDQHGNEIKVIRKATNYCFIHQNRFAAYLENRASKIICTADWRAKDVNQLLIQIKNLYKHTMQSSLKKLEIAEINDQPASKSQLADSFIDAGFERDGTILVLWPSGL